MADIRLSVSRVVCTRSNQRDVGFALGSLKVMADVILRVPSVVSTGSNERDVGFALCTSLSGPGWARIVRTIICDIMFDRPEGMPFIRFTV